MILIGKQICEYSIFGFFSYKEVWRQKNKMIYHVDVTDGRTGILKRLLEERGFKTEIYAPQAAQVKPSDTVVFSPAKKLSMEEASALPENVTVVCGGISGEVEKIIASKNITHRNIMLSEEFAIKNACLTAEGVLALILEKSKKSIYENNILILGNGRIATALAVLLGKIGARFALVAYDKAKVPKHYIYTEHVFHGKEFLGHIYKYDVLVNTIPAKIFSDEEVELIPKGAVLIETASVLCLDKNLAENFEFVDAPGLPQKYSALSAAKLMMEYILGESL